MPVAPGLRYHVNGVALVYIGPQGTTGALQQLGVSEDGVDFTISNYADPVMTDAGGGAVPSEFIDQGRDADIGIALNLYDDSVLRQMYERRSAGGVEGTDLLPGTPIFTAGLGFRLVIQSPNEDPWRFFYCLLRAPNSTKLGTRDTIWRLRIYGARPVLPTPSAGQAQQLPKALPLFDRRFG